MKEPAETLLLVSRESTFRIRKIYQRTMVFRTLTTASASL